MRGGAVDDICSDLTALNFVVWFRMAKCSVNG